MTETPFVTYRNADREPICGEYSFVTDLDYWFDDIDEPVELVEEVWDLRVRRTFWQVPNICYESCSALDCDEDAESWRMVEDKPAAVCETHGHLGWPLLLPPVEATR